MGKRFQVRYPKRAAKAAPVKNIRIKTAGRHDLEQLSFALQRAIAGLQDQDVYSVESVSVYLAPLNQSGDRMTLMDARGKPVEVIEIRLPVTARFSRATAA
jgi:hypothetical protein